jgi:hypothetical protein
MVIWLIEGHTHGGQSAQRSTEQIMVEHMLEELVSNDFHVVVPLPFYSCSSHLSHHLFK